jgi:hypothetical protein
LEHIIFHDYQMTSLSPQHIVDHTTTSVSVVVDDDDAALPAASSSSMWIPLRPDGTEIIIPHWKKHTSAEVLFSNTNLRSMVDPTTNNDAVSTTIHDLEPNNIASSISYNDPFDIPSSGSSSEQVPVPSSLPNEPSPPPPANGRSLRLLQQEQEQQELAQEHQRMIRTMEETGYLTEMHNQIGGHDHYYCGNHSSHNDINSNSNNSIKVLYPLHNRSRQSIFLDSTLHNEYNSTTNQTILVVQLYDPPYTVLALCINGQIQYMIPDPTSPPQLVNATSNPLASSIHPNDHRIMNCITFRSVVYEMMTHIPMCSVKIEPSYILIVNSFPSIIKKQICNKHNRNTNRMVGYGILQQLLQYYTSSIYKIILVEEDPILYEIYTQYFNPMMRDDDRITVVHTNPLLVNEENDNDANNISSNCIISNRYHVIFLVEDDPVVMDDDDTTTRSLRDQYRTSIFRALVPNGGVACFLTRPINLQSQPANDTDDDSRIIMKYEYAAIPTMSYNDHFINPSNVLILQLCIRSNNMRRHETKENTTDPFTPMTNDQTAIMNPEPITCHIPIRRVPGSSSVGTTAFPLLNWYSSATHVAAFTLPPIIQRQLFPLCDDNNGTNDPSHNTIPMFAPTSLSSSREVKTSTSTTSTHPKRMTNERSSHQNSDDDTSEENANTTTCQPQHIRLGCIGDNIHHWIQRHIAKVTTNSKFVSIPPS